MASPLPLVGHVCEKKGNEKERADERTSGRAERQLDWNVS